VRLQTSGTSRFIARKDPSGLPYPYAPIAFKHAVCGIFSSQQRPIMRGQTRFVGQGALERAGDAEDEHVFRRYFSRDGAPPIRRNGTFVELGAFNGVSFSNTLMFERELGWSGLLVEANPINFEDLTLTRGRSGRNTLLHAAACATGHVRVRMSGSTSSVVAIPTGVGGVGVRLEQHGGTSAGASARGGNATSATARCLPMHAMLRRAQLRSIDFMSIDVQSEASRTVHALSAVFT
jgi:hypothetical protein